MADAVQPRPAATVIVVRDGLQALELLLVQRSPRASFVAGAWVFPGGAVDPGDGPGEAGIRAAALRELAEEAVIELDSAGELVPFARWITPPDLPQRFDTWFFLARAPHGARAVPDGGEIVAARWLSPTDALAGDLQLVYPTIKTLEQLAPFELVDALLAWAAEREPPTYRPPGSRHR